MYAKCGSIAAARKVFDAMEVHDLVTWNAMLLGYAINGELEVTLELFFRIQSQQWHGFPLDARTFLAPIMACTGLAKKEEAAEVDGKFLKLNSLKKGIFLHSLAAKSGFDSDVFVASSFVDMYANCGSLEDARSVFDKMLRKDVVTWNSLILGYAENGDGEIALKLFQEMQCSSGSSGTQPNSRTFVAAVMACTSLALKEVGSITDGRFIKLKSLDTGMSVHLQASRFGYDSDIFVASSLVTMYSKCGSLRDAIKAFHRASHRNVVLWTSLMTGFSDNGEANAALQMFFRMNSECGCAADSRAFVAALGACTSLAAALEIGRRIHAEICRCGFEKDTFVANSLMDFYCKSGSLASAELVFCMIGRRNLVSWGTLLAGYGLRGEMREVFGVFQQMHEDGFRANGVIFLSILTGCSHAGLIETGKKWFERMKNYDGVKLGIEHYHCMLDLLGRGNLLEEAVEMARMMPFEASCVTWTTVLAACKKWKNVEAGKIAFEALMKLDDAGGGVQGSAYALMANIYGSVGMWENQSRLLEVLRS